MAATTVTDLIAALDSVGTTPGWAELTDAERLEVTHALRRTLYRLQTPFERAWDMSMADPHVYAAVKTTMDLGLWKAWGAADAAGRGGDKSLDELVGLCDKQCHPNLLRRVMRLLAARHVVEEIGDDRFRTNSFSASLAEDNMDLTMRCGTNAWLPEAANIPDHLASLGYQDPNDAEDTAYIKMASNSESLDFFARLRSQPEHQDEFFACMANITKWKQDWTEYFDTSHLVDDEVMRKGESGIPIFVDVGGSSGTDVTRFLKSHPDVPAGSLVLQDTPDVIAMAKQKIDPKITAVAYDFFKPQPIINSRVYFFHAVFHDWPDPLAHQILTNLRPALQPGYSRLLITDVVVPTHGASVMQAAHDVMLMGLLAARERTEAEWSQLLSGAGFEVLRVWRDAKGVESVIEAALKEEEMGERDGENVVSTASMASADMRA